MTNVLILDGQYNILWKDLWNGQVRELQFPELFSSAKKQVHKPKKGI